MAEPIKAGDLAYVVGNAQDLLCEHVTKFLGLPLTVDLIVPSANLHCPACGRTWSHVVCAVFATRGLALRVSWLKKFDPPALDEKSETEIEKETV